LRILGSIVLAAVLSIFVRTVQAAERPPNVVLIVADDLGWGDLGCYGNRRASTPNLDLLARQGRRLTSFHAAQPVCSASRAALLTGCYPNRLGVHGALGPGARHGIHTEEATLAEILRMRGYATGMAGKWHLGHHPPFLPMRHGFDEYLGLPYSNDMWPAHPEARPGAYPPLPLIEGGRIVDDDVTAEDQAGLTRRYTERAVRFIARNRGRPFFFYLAHTMPHVPLFAGPAFRGRTGLGLYHDVIAEIDWSVGEVMRALRENGLERDTVVVFTSDNGPWLSYGEHAGSAGPFREGKGTVWEGGVRVPFIVRWPGRLAPGVCDRFVMAIDLLPTIARLTGSPLRRRPIDGQDVWPLIAGVPGASNPHEAYAFYYGAGELQAVASGDGRWKLVLPHTFNTLGGRPGGAGGRPARYEQHRVERPELYDLQADEAERHDVARWNPDVMRRLQEAAERFREELGDSLTGRKGSGIREPGRLPG